jgi:Peroxin-3.
MLAATRRWVKRYRVPIALSFGVVGAGYLVTNYVVNKLRDARERMTSDRIAKEKCVFLSFVPFPVACNRTAKLQKGTRPLTRTLLPL